MQLIDESGSFKNLLIANQVKSQYLSAQVTFDV
ncbi:hypothetical protein MNBD_GAMMA07-1877 [hydrothermal vent metagenome]|uniref:Uncharacterized protein n=1 Tax=hydrothermal vent metagenome TaxID=652676 RepID=A0A3B0XL29_9ZZZZ